jgi:GMP synthase-like glutamine amidotransferase
MILHILQHDPDEGPGAIADWAAARGHALRTTHVYRGDALPDLESGDLLVAMGGPMNIYQDRDHPWLRAERSFLERHIGKGGRALGVCLGAQLLADALGGRVMQNSQVEIGWFPVRFTDEARALFPFLPEEKEIMHWHGDTFELPAGAMRLGTSEACANQGFLYEGRILGLQFHAEVTRDFAAALLRQAGTDLRPEAFVQDGQTILGHSDADFESAHTLLSGLLDAVFPS